MLTRSRWWPLVQAVLLVAWIALVILEGLWRVPTAGVALVTAITAIVLSIAATEGRQHRT